MKEIIVLGAGSWVREQYARALKPYRLRGECGVFFVYDTGYAQRMGLGVEEAEQYNRYTLSNVGEFESWGATCIDLADESGREHLKGLSPYAVFVVTPDNTHCDMVEEWLDRASNIFVEKPFDIDHERIRRLHEKVNSGGLICDVWGFDHYLVRANQFVKMKEHLGFDAHLGGKIHQFRFNMLEAGEAGIERRAASLQSGLIMDLGSHTPALVLAFGDPGSISFDYVKAGVYEPGGGVLSSGRNLIMSGMETFAEVKFSFTSVFGDLVDATVCVGKCVGLQDEKYVEVVGGADRDRAVRLDMKSCIVDFGGGDSLRPVTSLFSNPIELLIREVMAERHPESLALFDLRMGQSIVERLNEWRQPIIEHVGKGNKLEGYTAGDSLDQILSGLSPL